MPSNDRLLGGEKEEDDEEQAGSADSNKIDEVRSKLKGLTAEWKERAARNKQRKEAFAHKGDDEESQVAPWRKKLGLALESTYTHAFILGLLLIDLLATVIDVLHTLHNDSRDLSRCVSLVESCQCVSSFETSESWEFLYWIGIFVLCVLSLNLIGLLVACGLSFFRHAGYILDAVVVVTALCLEILLDTETAGLLVILNLWRIVRVAHGVLEVTDEAWEKKIRELEVQIKKIEADHQDDRDTIDRLELQVADFRGRLNE